MSSQRCSIASLSFLPKPSISTDNINGMQSVSLRRLFVHYCSFGDKTNRSWLYSSKFHKMVQEADLSALVQKQALDLLIIRIAKTQVKDRVRLSFDQFVQLLSYLEQQIGQILPAKLCVLEHKLFPSVQPGEKRHRVIQTEQSFEYVVAMAGPLRKLYQSRFKQQLGLKDTQQLKKQSQKTLFRLLKQTDIYPGLVSRSSVTNLYQYSLENYDRLALAEQGSVFTFIRFLNFLARLPQFLNATSLPENQRINLIFQKLVNRDIIKLPQDPRQKQSLRQPLRILVDQAEVRSRTPSPSNKKFTFNQSMKISKCRPTLGDRISTTPTGLRYGKLKQSSHSRSKGRMDFRLSPSNKERSLKHVQLATTLKDIFNYYCQTEGASLQRINLGQVIKLTMNSPKVFTGTRETLYIMFSNASRGKKSLDFYQFQDLLIAMMQSSQYSNFRQFLRLIELGFRNAEISQHQRELMVLQVVSEESRLCALLELMKGYCRRLYQEFDEGQGITEDDLVLLLRRVELFPQYCTRKKVHSGFYLLRDQSKTGFRIDLQNIMKVLVLIAEDLQLKQTLPRKTAFIFDILVHSSGFADSIRFAVNKPVLQATIHEELRRFRESYR